MQRKKIFISVVLILIITLACGQSNNLPLEASGGLESDIATATLGPTPVVHVMVPPDLVPETQLGAVGDQDSSITANQNRAPSGDRFTFGRYERPFNANTMDIYHPELDIQSAYFYEDETWYFVEFNLKNNNSSFALTGKYGFEIDLDVDGGGDWFILISQPSLPEWSTSGVEVWFDTNDDVGGTTPIYTDSEPAQGNGYETLVFGEAQGNDPDLAWGRTSPDDPYTVYIAFKKSLFEGDASFMVGMWTGTDDLNPALFDFNDYYTHEQAGTSLIELENYYPVKELSELDNTCRIAIGFQPLGNEPGLCALPGGDPEEIPPPPGSTPPPPGLTCPPPAIVFCNANGDCYCLEPQG